MDRAVFQHEMPASAEIDRAASVGECADGHTHRVVADLAVADGQRHVPPGRDAAGDEYGMVPHKIIQIVLDRAASAAHPAAVGGVDAAAIAGVVTWMGGTRSAPGRRRRPIRHRRHRPAPGWRAAVGQRQIGQRGIGSTAHDLEDPAGIPAAHRHPAAVVVRSPSMVTSCGQLQAVTVGQGLSFGGASKRDVRVGMASACATASRRLTPLVRRPRRPPSSSSRSPSSGTVRRDRPRCARPRGDRPVAARAWPGPVAMAPQLSVQGSAAA